MNLKKYIEEHATVLKNMIALIAIQGTNFLIPLIIMPYLIPIIGFAKFGTIGWVQVIIIYFGVFADYSFNILATRNVALHKNNHQKLSEIFSRVLTIKLLLCLLSFILIGLLILVIPEFHQEKTTILLALTIIMGQVITPVWFFQGIEKMFWLTILTLIAKVSAAIFIFTVIKILDEYIYFLCLLGVGNIIAGVIALNIVFFKYKLVWIKPSLMAFYAELREGWSTFISNLAITSIMLFNLLMLSFFEEDKDAVGYYSLAEKIVLAIWQILIVFSQAIYPRLCQLASESHFAVKKFYKQLFIPFCFFVLVICIVVFIKADFVVYIFSGASPQKAVDLLKIMTFVPFIVVLNIPFHQTLLAYDLKNAYSKVMIITFLFNITVGMLCISRFGGIGAAFTMVMTQIFQTSFLIFMLEYEHRSKRILFKIVE